MSLENVELVYASFAALNQRDVQALLDLLDRDVELNSAISPLEGAFRGHEGIRAYLATIWGPFQSLIWEVERVTGVDDEQLIAYVRAHGRGATSDAGIEQHMVVVYRVRRGKALRIDSYLHESEALDAMGLRG
jgi:ketosteroid isomerase-like protein